MKLHSNTLTWSDVHDALRTAKDTGNVARHIDFEICEERGSRSRKNGFEIQLGTYTKIPGDKRRFKNSGAYGASDVYAATRDEWGWFIDAVFNLDPAAVFGPYSGRIDFHKATRYAYGD